MISQYIPCTIGCMCVCTGQRANEHTIPNNREDLQNCFELLEKLQTNKPTNHMPTNYRQMLEVMQMVLARGLLSMFSEYGLILHFYSLINM